MDENNLYQPEASSETKPSETPEEAFSAEKEPSSSESVPNREEAPPLSKGAIEQPEAPGVSVRPQTYWQPVLPYGFTPELYEEKLNIRKTAFTVGLSFLIVLISMFFWIYPFLFFAGLFGIGRARISEIISDPAVSQIVQIAISSLVFLFPFTVIFKSKGYRVSELVPLGRPKKGTALPCFLIAASFCAFANFAVSQASAVFESMGIHYEVDFGENPPGFFGFLLSVLATAVVPPLVEEFACRGLAMGLLRKHGDSFAVISSAVLFGLMHGNFEQMPFAFLVGLALAFITVKTGTLWVAVAVHAMNNFSSVFFNYALKSFSTETGNIIYVIYLLCWLLIGILALSSSLARQKDFFRLETGSGVCSEAKRHKWFFTSPVAVVFSVLCVLEAMIYFII